MISHLKLFCKCFFQILKKKAKTYRADSNGQPGHHITIMYLFSYLLSISKFFMNAFYMKGSCGEPGPIIHKLYSILRSIFNGSRIRFVG